MTTPVIVHVYDDLHPHQGGPPQVILNLARAQRNQGAEIRLVARDVDQPEVASFIRAQIGEARLFKLVPRGLRPWRSRELIDSALHEATAVHLHSIWPTPNLFVAHRCLQRHIPYVLSIHGHLRREALAIKALKKRVGLALGYRAMLRGATLIHALNQSEAQDVRTFGLTAPCEVIPNGITPPRRDQTPPRSLLNQKIPQLEDAPYLLFLSRIHPPKGALNLVQAFIELSSAHPHLHLVVAGSDFGGVNELKSEIQRAGLNTRFHLPGFLSGDLKAAALAHAEAFCLPSYHEGFSVAVLESLSWGTPTVISTGCHFPEIARADVGWVHELGTPPLTATLTSVLADRDRSQAKAKRGQAWVAERYQWSHIERQYHRLYQQLTSRGVSTNVVQFNKRAP